MKQERYGPIPSATSAALTSRDRYLTSGEVDKMLSRFC